MASEPAATLAAPSNIAESSIGIIPLPANGATALAKPPKGILVQTAGNMGLTMADGTTNDAALVAVTAGQWFHGLSPVKASASNTAVLLAVY